MTNDLVNFTDYAGIATDLRVVICGSKAEGFHPKVRGIDPETGGEVTVAYYELERETSAEARKLGTAMRKLTLAQFYR